MERKTIVVGGGIAGMSCALRLLEANEDFQLITDSLGGRVMYSPEEKINYGAYFVMASYVNARKLLTQTTLINPLHACFHNSSDERFSVLSWHTLTLLPEFLRFYFAMQEFSKHYEIYKQRCLVMCQKKALEADLYMADLFSKPASQFIREKHFEKVAFDYISKFAYACTGVSTDSITAMDFLNVSMGILISIHQFTFDSKATADQFHGHLVTDTIIKIESQPGCHTLTGKSGHTYQAENVVVATPAAVTKELLNLSEIRDSCKLYVFHVNAVLKQIYQKFELNLFPATSEIILIARQFDGSYLIYSRTSEVDLFQVCDSFTLLATKAWDKAMYVQGKAYMEQQYGDGLYVAGDHNGLGLEPAAISGIYAANQIIASSR